MSVTLIFLGKFADLAGTPERVIPAPLNWDGLLEAVGPELAEQLRGERARIACAGQVLADKRTLSAQDGDEVALLPPVSGG